METRLLTVPVHSVNDELAVRQAFGWQLSQASARSFATDGGMVGVGAHVGSLLTTASTSADPAKLFVLEGDHVFLRDRRDAAEPSGWLRTASASLTGVRSLSMSVKSPVVTAHFEAAGSEPFCAVADAIEGRVSSGDSMTNILQAEVCVANRPATMHLTIDPKKQMQYDGSSVISGIDAQVTMTPEGAIDPVRFAILSVQGVPRNIRVDYDAAAGSLGFDTDTPLTGAFVHAFDVAGLAATTNPPVRHAYASVSNVPTKALVTWQNEFKTGAVSFDGQSVGRIAAALATTADVEDLRLFAGNHAIYSREGSNSWLSLGVDGIRGGSWGLDSNGVSASIQTNGVPRFDALYESTDGATHDQVQVSAFGVPSTMSFLAEPAKKVVYDASTGAGTRIIAFGNIGDMEFESQIDGLPTHIETIMDSSKELYKATISGPIDLVYMSATDPTGLLDKQWKRAYLLIEELPGSFTMDASDMRHLALAFPPGMSVDQVTFFLTTMPEPATLLYSSDHVVLYDNSEGRLAGNPSYPQGEWIGGKISGFHSFAFDALCDRQNIVAQFVPGGQPLLVRYAKDTTASVAGTQNPTPPPASRCPTESTPGGPAGDDAEDVIDNLDYLEAYISNVPATTKVKLAMQEKNVDVSLSQSVDVLEAWTTIGEGDLMQVKVRDSATSMFVSWAASSGSGIDIQQNQAANLYFAYWDNYEDDSVFYTWGIIKDIAASWQFARDGHVYVDTNGALDPFVIGKDSIDGWGFQTWGLYSWDNGCVDWNFSLGWNLLAPLFWCPGAFQGAGILCIILPWEADLDSVCGTILDFNYDGPFPGPFI